MKYQSAFGLRHLLIMAVSVLFCIPGAWAKTCTTLDLETNTVKIPSVQVGTAFLKVDLQIAGSVFRLGTIGAA